MEMSIWNDLERVDPITFGQKCKVAFEIFMYLLVVILLLSGFMFLILGTIYIVPILWGINKILAIGTALVAVYLIILLLVIVANIDNKKEDNK